MIFITAFSVLFPLFAKIAFGYGIRHLNILSEKSLKEVNTLIYRLFIPTLLFANIYQTTFSTITDYSMLWYALLIVLGLFILYMLIVPLFEKENPKRGVLVQGVIRSNFIIFGVPMATTLYEVTDLGVGALMIGIVVPLFNIISVISLEYFRGKKPEIKPILIGVATNPIIIGGVAGLVCALLGIRFPRLLENFIFDIANMATPLALIILGASVTFTSLKGNFKSLCFGMLHRLIIVPLIGMSICIAAGFRDVQLVLLLAMLGTPVAVSTFTMAQQLEGDADLAGQFVVVSTAVSLFTLFAWISALMALGFI